MSSAITRKILQSRARTLAAEESAPEPWLPRLGQVPQELARICMTLSHSMAHAAQENDWSRVQELENSRRRRLEELFAAPEADDVEALREFIHALQEIDALTLTSGRDRQKRLKREMQDLRLGKRANDSYQRAGA